MQPKKLMILQKVKNNNFLGDGFDNNYHELAKYVA